MIKDKTVQNFLDELASDAPTPGGGSAAGVMGGMGAALISMVCNLTIGKPKYAEVEGEMKDILKVAEALRAEMTDLIRADIEVFDQVMAAYGMARESDEDKLERSAAIQIALKAATEVPLQCARACARTIEICGDTAENGNLNVISDAGVAVMALNAALKSAALNVYTNTGSIKDKSYAQSALEEIDSLVVNAEARSAQIYAVVKGKL